MQIEAMDRIPRIYPTTARTICSVLAVLVTILTGQWALAADSDVYESISEDGSTLFTDKPKGSTNTLAPLGSDSSKYSSQDGSNKNAEYEESAMEPADPKPLTVTSVKITSPGNEQSFINPRGPILIGIATGPENGMPEGYTSEIKIDGKTVTSAEGTLLAIPSTHGTHVLEAIVLDSTGTEMAKSQPVTIHIKQRNKNKSQ